MRVLYREEGVQGILHYQPILGKTPYVNQAMGLAEATMTCIMAREAAYSGLEVTWDMIMKSQLDLQPKQFGYEVKMEPRPLPVPGEYKFI
jgi:hypothetical protein